MQVSSIENFEQRFQEIMEKDINVNKNAQERFSEIIQKNTHTTVEEISDNNFLTEMVNTQNKAKGEMIDVLLDRSDNAHQALINMEEAKLQMELAGVVRDKITNGVNQLDRKSVV